MRKFSLQATAHEHLDHARASTTGRSATTIYGGHEQTLRQTLLALTAGTQLTEHASPGEATLFVLTGRVRLHCGDEAWDGRDGDLITIPQARHSLEALKDSAAILTVVKHVH